jgi:glycosyltransferase involved in cell wall biosynthesis
MGRQKNMKYSVGVPVFLREDAHRQVVMDTLENIKNTSDGAEIIVVNNGSTIMSGFLKDYADVYINNEKNLGIAPAWNQIMDISRGEYVVICNDDILVPEHWLEVLEEPFYSHFDCAVSAPMSAGFDQKPFILMGKVAEENYKFYPGYCFMLNKNRFFEHFDEQFFPGQFEDVDYWVRVKKSKQKLMRAPLSIWHKEGDVLHKMNYKEMNKINYKKFIDKWGFDPQSYFYGDGNIEEIL